MKPTKIRVMCPDCGRMKARFETEKEANGFIKWNGNEIFTHGEPLRAYYCPACCGWHITHHAYKEEYSLQTDRLLEAYSQSKAKNYKSSELKAAEEQSYLEEMANADIDTVFDKRALHKWLKENVESSDKRSAIANLAGRLRQLKFNSVPDWRLDYLKQNCKK